MCTLARCDISATYQGDNHRELRRREIPAQYLKLFDEWVRRARRAGFGRQEFADGIEEILQEFCVKGKYAGARFLLLWTQLLREQQLTVSSPGRAADA
jgi:hypothetical protein